MDDTGEISTPPTPQDSVREWAKTRLLAIEELLDADGLTIISPMHEGVEHHVKSALEGRRQRRSTLFVILGTLGGVVEVVERIVTVLRKHYTEVKFIIPDKAMSAGTVLAMSGDEIWMDYHSCLGPIDPQLPQDGRMLPALSYLAQYERLIEKSRQGALATAEIVLLGKLDLAELHQFELARDLSIDLLKRWLTSYKFKDWTTTDTRHVSVTKEMKVERAEEIAHKLSDHTRWLTHGRGINMETLREELQLKIDDLDDYPELKASVWDYYWFLQHSIGTDGSIVHAPHYF